MILTAETIGIIVTASIVAIALILAFIKANLEVCPPNELLIFSGRRRKLKDGTMAGYRVIKGGRGLKLPIIETVSRMPLNTFTVDMELLGALTNGLIPINIEAMANVKVAGSEDKGLNNALERFLGRNIGDISQVAKETIEGSLRGVLATMAPEEANEKRLEFAEKVSSQAGDDLKKLGLVLDTFKIKSISDTEGYLDNIGRKKSAEVKRDAVIAEAKTESEARVAAADAKTKGSIAEYKSDIMVIEAENSFKVKKAKLTEEVNRAESKAIVAGDIARVTEEQKLEEARVKMNKRKYEADVVVPAQADKEAKVLYAKGKAARIIEDGKGMAESVKLLRQEWEKEDTRELFLIQQLPMILDKITGVIKDNLRVDKLTILDGGDGNGLPTLVKGITGSTAAVFEGIKSATGLDIPDIMQSKKGGSSSDSN